MKRRTLWSVLLAVSLLLGLLSGCGGESSSNQESASSGSVAEATEAPVEQETPETETPAAQPEASVVESTVEAETEETTTGDPFAAMAEEYITYPLAGENTISIWYYAPGYVEYVDSNYKFNAIDEAEAATGVKLEFIEVGNTTAAEQFNLMVASGDMTDLIPASEYYTGGLTKAYEEDIIVDINEYVEENMPNYAAVFETLDEKTQRLTSQMHKAIAVIQFKLESQLFKKHPEWKMKDRCLFDHIDYRKGKVEIDGKEYDMTSCHFPTIDPDNPDKLSEEEEILIQKLHHSFMVCEKLHKHIKVMLQHGCMYAIFNNNLLFHASCPLNEDGSLKEVEIYPGKKFSGRALMHHTGMQIRTAFQSDSDPNEKEYAIDYFIYLWCGPDSPLFDKSKMATFERYFITDKETHKEEKGYYFLLRDNEQVIDHIMDEFGVTGPNRHIINGHVPVRTTKGENPIKANGKLMVIDGGFSKAYHNETGIAGYTLVYHSRGFQLVQHEPFTSMEDAIKQGTDIKSTTQIVEMSNRRMLVADTDIGCELRKQIEDLKELLYAYRHGFIKESERKK